MVYSLHKQFSTLSFKHKFEFHRIVNHFIGLRGIEYFELAIKNPAGEYVSFCTDPTLVQGLIKRGYGDGMLNAVSLMPFYDELTIWRNSQYVNDPFLDELTYLTQVTMGITDGLSLIRCWDDFSILYSFATRKGNKKFAGEIKRNANFFFRIGDFTYNEFRETYVNYAGGFIPPKITKFYPYNGGEPPENHYSNQFKRQVSRGKKIIQVDFLERKVLSS